MEFPKAFESRMRCLLGPEYAAFAASYGRPLRPALRVNGLKGTASELAAQLPFTLAPVPWARMGYYVQGEERPGRHPLHEAGAYYVQEASAMAVASAVSAQPGERVLDLCAAPGGKATQLAADLQGQGLLVANEIHPARAKVLSQNLERMGARNAVVTNEAPDRLAARFPAFFDRVVVDAPCSGEGMFRKEPQAVTDWSPEAVLRCAQRQRDILEQAALMVRPGGCLYYSTCTFAPEEDEGLLAGFLAGHPDYALEPLPNAAALSPGRPQWGDGDPALARAGRIWPHLSGGEGHFLAALRRQGTGEHAPSLLPPPLPCPGPYRDFSAQFLQNVPQGELALLGDRLCLAPLAPQSLHGLKLLRLGLELGALRKGRFEPAHALAMALRPGDARQTLRLAPDAPELAAYLRGETLSVPPALKGWVLVCAGEYSLGWGKAVNGVLKNHYPKGLRRNMGETREK